MRPVCTGEDEWWCNWYECSNCHGKDEYSANSNIARNFTYCPDCGIKIDWSEEE